MVSMLLPTALEDQSRHATGWQQHLRAQWGIRRSKHREAVLALLKGNTRNKVPWSVIKATVKQQSVNFASGQIG